MTNTVVYSVRMKNSLLFSENTVKTSNICHVYNIGSKVKIRGKNLLIMKEKNTSEEVKFPSYNFILVPTVLLYSYK
jgi:hypothetical protein